MGMLNSIWAFLIKVDIGDGRIKISAEKEIQNV